MSTALSFPLNECERITTWILTIWNQLICSVVYPNVTAKSFERQSAKLIERFELQSIANESHPPEENYAFLKIRKSEDKWSLRLQIIIDTFLLFVTMSLKLIYVKPNDWRPVVEVHLHWFSGQSVSVGSPCALKADAFLRIIKSPDSKLCSSWGEINVLKWSTVTQGIRISSVPSKNDLKEWESR